MSKISISLFVAAVLAAAIATPASATGVAGFAGTWINSTPQLDSISKIIVKETSSKTLQVSVFGPGCASDVRCGWGSRDAVAYAPNANSTDLPDDADTVIAIFGSSGETIQLVLRNPGVGVLNVQAFTWYHGTPGTNYWTEVPFHKSQ